MTGVRFHPWRHFREMTSWMVRFAPLPLGQMGETCYHTRTITLAPDLTQAERLSTITHEVVHAERGEYLAIHEAREERAVAREAARRLIPWPALVEACRWARDVHELADELWVDEDTIVVRLKALHPSERAHIVSILEDRA